MKIFRAALSADALRKQLVNAGEDPVHHLFSNEGDYTDKGTTPRDVTIKGDTFPTHGQGFQPSWSFHDVNHYGQLNTWYYNKWDKKRANEWPEIQEKKRAEAASKAAEAEAARKEAEAAAAEAAAAEAAAEAAAAVAAAAAAAAAKEEAKRKAAQTNAMAMIESYRETKKDKNAFKKILPEFEKALKEAAQYKKWDGTIPLGEKVNWGCYVKQHLDLQQGLQKPITDQRAQDNYDNFGKKEGRDHRCNAESNATWLVTEYGMTRAGAQAHVMVKYSDDFETMTVAEHKEHIAQQTRGFPQMTFPHKHQDVTVPRVQFNRSHGGVTWVLEKPSTYSSFSFNYSKGARLILTSATRPASKRKMIFTIHKRYDVYLHTNRLEFKSLTHWQSAEFQFPSEKFAPNELMVIGLYMYISPGNDNRAEVNRNFVCFFNGVNSDMKYESVHQENLSEDKVPSLRQSLNQQLIRDEKHPFWYGVYEGIPNSEYPIQVYGLYHHKYSGVWDMRYAEDEYKNRSPHNDPDWMRRYYGNLGTHDNLHIGQRQRELVRFVRVLMSRYEFNATTNTLTFKELQPGQGYYFWFSENFNYTTQANHVSYLWNRAEYLAKHGPRSGLAPGAP